MKYLVCGNYGAGNLGDELILQGLIEFLKKADQNSEITVMSANPEQTKKHYQVKAVHHFPAGIRSILRLSKATKEAMKNCDYFILGGGGLFGSLTFRANLIWGIQAYQAYRAKKPMFIMGQSIGELKGRIRKYIVRKVVNYAKLIVFRDIASLRHSKKAYLADDFALKQHKQGQQKKKALICLKSIPNLTHNAQNFVQYLQSEGWEVKYINFQEPDDQQTHKDLQIPQGSYQDFKDAGFVLGMRLHSIISAINYRIPFIAINYAPKVKNLLETYQMENHIADPKDLKQAFLKHDAQPPNPSLPHSAQNRYLDQQSLVSTFQSYLKDSQD